MTGTKPPYCVSFKLNRAVGPLQVFELTPLFPKTFTQLEGGSDKAPPNGCNCVEEEMREKTLEVLGGVSSW